jgi:hypothetical protein
VLREFKVELQLIDPLSYKRLSTLMPGREFVSKTEILEYFNLAPQVNELNDIPLVGPKEEEIAAVTLQLIENSEIAAAVDGGEFIRKQDMNAAMVAKIQAIQDSYKNGTVRWTGLWDEEVYKKIQDYLTNRKPREQLDEIQEIANALRANIVKIFPLNEILWTIGSRNFRNQYGHTVLKGNFN